MLLVLRNKKKLKLGRGCVTEEQDGEAGKPHSPQLALPLSAPGP